MRSLVCGLSFTIALMFTAVAAAHAQAARPLATPRVRTHNATIAALIARATERSQTFRGLIETIDMSDGIVYVERGECGLGIRACLLLTVGIAGDFRLLYVRIDTSRPDRELMGSIGHELQHAIEVLSHARARTDVAVEHLFRTIGRRSRGKFETMAAIDVGDAVRAETAREPE